MIQVEHISKTFKVSRRSAGFLEAFKALFHREYECVSALDDILILMKEMVGYIYLSRKEQYYQGFGGILTQIVGLAISTDEFHGKKNSTCKTLGCIGQDLA